MIRSHVLAFTLGLAALSAFALGGCAVQTASGDPSSQTEEGRAEPTGSASAGSAEGQTASESTALNSLHEAAPTGKKPATESSSDAVKAQVQTGCSATNPCSGAAADGTQPLPWIEPN